VAWEPYAELPAKPNQRVHIASGGGHLGFLGPDGRGGVRWAETQIIDWVVEQSARFAK
jgi:predicted alpha/beta-fold hydrolase